MRKKRVVLYFVLGVMALIFILLFIRMFSSRQLDDVSPEISCSDELLKKADVFYIIPKFNNKSISENNEWCLEIVDMNKELGLHGVKHTYHEFLTDRDDAYLLEGVDIFEKCFGFAPKRFKPPQLKISKNNKLLVKRMMKLDLVLNQIFHKVYHCDDSGRFPNWFIDLF